MMDQSLQDLILSCFTAPSDQKLLERLDAALRPLILPILISITGENPELARDSYQEAFVKYLKLFRTKAKPNVDYEAYFVAIAKNCLIDELRRTGRQVQIDEMLEVEIAQRKHARQVDRTDARIDVLQALAKLPARCRFALESRYIRGMDAAELAERLGVSLKSVYVVLQRCREALRKKLEHSC